MTNERELLELVAKAMGGRFELENGFPNLNGNFWNPLASQADSDRMACKLRIGHRFLGGNVVEAWQGFGDMESITHNNTDEDVCRAAREAVLMVAAEIGRAK